MLPSRSFSFSCRSLLVSLIFLLRWTLIALPLAAIVGSLVALFLWLLEIATSYRTDHSWLLWLLPVAGVAIHFLYKFSGKNAERGNDLVLDEIHEPGGGVPVRMAPLVLATTVITHLFGGSAGREGTAVQIGGSLSSWLGKLLKLSAADTKIMLQMGVAAGFGAVFGTPAAGAVFALEVLVSGRLSYRSLWPCLAAAILADKVVALWQVHHTLYSIAQVLPESLTNSPAANAIFFLKISLAGLAFGLASRLFRHGVHSLKKFLNARIRISWLIPVFGGLAIIALTFLLGTKSYLGLGVLPSDVDGISIINAFKAGGVTDWSWLLKLIFTVVTLATGFKGGEVTPLFFIGAALGSALAVHLCLPVDLLAALGFVAVFAGATNTPIACTIMGVELFGGGALLYFAITCILAWYVSGKGSIYNSQKKGIAKR